MRRSLLLLMLFLSAARGEAGMVMITFHSPSLEKNLLGDPADQKVEIYLPPSYERDAGRRYPVLYLLHGFYGSTGDFTQPVFQGFTIEQAMNDLARGGAEMIVVIPNGRNRLGGSYFRNSSVTGNWEDYLIRDLLPYIDKTYRTLPQPASRGVAGHSMGGTAAIMMAMTHPGLFASVYAMSPCCLAWKDDFGPANPAWRVVSEAKSVDDLTASVSSGDFMPLAIASAAAAFVPNPTRPALPFDLPFTVRDGKVVRDDAVDALWRSKQPINLVVASASNLKQLRGLAFEAGFDDQFKHIPITTRELSAMLSENSVPHIYEAFDGDHRNRLGDRMRTRVLPFFVRTLATAALETPATAVAVSPPKTSFPTAIDPSARYLFYFHPGFVERFGPEANFPPYGKYDYAGILRALQSQNLTVISEVRTKDRYWNAEAEAVVPNVRKLLAAGVPARNITLAGFSKGAVIALMTAAKIGNADLRVVGMATCSKQWRPDEQSTFRAIRPTGRILLMTDSNDSLSVPCGVASVTEKQFNEGHGYGFFFTPRDSWIKAVTEWSVD